jgi:dihydrofolate reductase
MASTIYLTATSLDGFIATEDNDLSWLFALDGGADPSGGAANPYDEVMQNVGAIAMGATTYEWLVEHEPGAWPFPDRPTWVFTHRPLTRDDDAPVRFTSGDVAGVHADMVAAARGRDLWLVGGGDLVGQFLDDGLLDEIWVSIAPLVLGRGAPLLPRRHTRPMRVLEVRHEHGDPFVHVHYSVR